MNPELLKWLQGVAVAVATAAAQYLTSAHPTLWGTVGIAVLTRVAGYGVGKLPSTPSVFQAPR